MIMLKFIRYTIKKLKTLDKICSLMAGLKFVDSELVVIMDDDLQHDPKYIINLENVMIKNNHGYFVIRILL